MIQILESALHQIEPLHIQKNFFDWIRIDNKGIIEWNAESFIGSLSDYINKLRHELTSQFRLFYAGSKNPKKNIKRIIEELNNLISEDYDDLGVVLHGEYTTINGIKQPFGNFIMGKDEAGEKIYSDMEKFKRYIQHVYSLNTKNECYGISLIGCNQDNTISDAGWKFKRPSKREDENNGGLSPKHIYFHVARLIKTLNGQPSDPLSRP